ncbi:SusF/SusE family outer membrane protein [Cloacibacterium sp.]|uniref:SusF/SusE family outer membrane protein n=1 Tax=Cloacibacterium sp. TaxID=1913682 RepID=UPI0039E6D693
MKSIKIIKNWNKKFLWIMSMLLLVAIACREELNQENFETSELSIKTSEISELLPNMFNSKFAFTWTPANNQGTSSAISYKLEIDKKENNFSNAQTYEIGKNVYSYEIPIGDLNTMLIEKFGATPGNAINMQVRITATFTNETIKPQVAITDFTLTPFKPFTKTLYILGDATLNGWDITNATELTQNANNPTEFVYYGQLKAGNFKFTVSKNDCWCQDFYNRDPSDDGKIVYNQGGNGTDLQWTIDIASLYKVTVNVLENTIKIDKMNGPQFSDVWIVGDTSPSGWDVNNPVALKQDLSNPFIFTIECSLKEGNFKFLTGTRGDWCGQWYRPLVNNQDLVATGMVQNSGCTGDNSWKVTSADAGRYLITLNTADNTIKFEPINVYLIGDATPNGWNMGTLSPMQKNGSVYTWTGNLKAGAFKFTKFNTTWCDGTELVAVSPDQSISNGAFQERVKCAGGDATDYKWKVNAGDSGTHTITLNLDTNLLEIK